MSLLVSMKLRRLVLYSRVGMMPRLAKSTAMRPSRDLEGLLGWLSHLDGLGNAL